MTGREEAAAGPWYREPYVLLVVGIPASALVMGAIMLWLSITSYDGVVADDYYKRGLEIERTLDRDRRAETLDIAARVTRGADGTVEVVLSAPDAPGAAPTLLLHHPTRQREDRTVALRALGGGRFVGDWPADVAGRWYLRLETESWRIGVGARDVERGPWRLAPGDL